LYTSVCAPYTLRYNYIDNAVIPGRNYVFYVTKVSVFSSNNLDIRNKFSIATEEKNSKKVAAYSRAKQVYKQNKTKEVYGDLLKELHIRNTHSKLGTTVKYILSKNIQISDLNMKYPQHIQLTYMKDIKKKSGLQNGRFTPNEDEVIKNKWNDLCCECGIENVIDLPREWLMTVNSEDLLERKQLNVIGCYLDPDLKKARHATEVIHRAIYLLNSFVTGKFKPEEDEIILQEVHRNGDNNEVFKDLCLKLNRNPLNWCILRTRYTYLIQRKDLNFDKWTIDEDKVIIDTLFMKKELGIDAIHSINSSEYKNFQQIKRNPMQVRHRYEGCIAPILLKYHYRKLGCNSNYEFMCYVVENEIKSVREIQWKEVLQLFPYETRKSLQACVNHIFHRYKNSPLDNLCLIFQKYLDYYKEHTPTENQIEYQSIIVEMYLNCKK
jgi:hypothetical protein